MARLSASVATRYAHSLEGRPTQEWHVLEDHLEQTANKAASFAASFGSSEWAYLGGLWHDLGKYSVKFQRMIGATGGSEAHIETKKGRVDHSTAGAIHAIRQLGRLGRVLAYIIAGHHAGLPDWRSEDGAGLMQRLEKTELVDAVTSVDPPSRMLERTFPAERPPQGADPALWIRLLFSCLVDADFLDTEAFLAPNRTADRGLYPTFEDLWGSFDEHMKQIKVGAADTIVNRIRRQVFEQCLEAANGPPGLYSLTVPTGGGKTLSSMAFALRHAMVHQRRRVIYVIPFNSIIEQTAGIFRTIFGDAVIEHHSNVDVSDESRETSRSRLATENWDAPLIVTTSVQFFESFFSNRSSRCRKLHNVAGSVVIFDEAQLLPPDFLYPILSLIEQLQRCYGVTAVLCTATQPALDRRDGFRGLERVTEIVSDPMSLYRALRRVDFDTSRAVGPAQAWESLAAELMDHDSALCIVNTRADCRTLYDLMPSGTIHLSALMCGAHRSRVIDTIRDTLKCGVPTRVISTQLVEAGVDVDFPIVYRALAGLDSIAQAAGRCNREGRLERGRVFVFRPPSEPPIGHLRQCASLARNILQSNPDDLLAPPTLRRFFQELFWLKGDRRLDRHEIETVHLKPDQEARYSFRTAASLFKMIDDAAQRPVVVRYGEGAALIARLQREGPHRLLMRRLQRYVVNIPVHAHSRLLASGDIAELSGGPGIYVQAHDAAYTEETGFQSTGAIAMEPDELII
ncbi:MAG: CRISPR-associated helicase Cas3' [Candidatus Xenobia bacterium]